MSGTLKHDDNDYPVSGGVSSADTNVVLPFKINPVTGRLLVQNSSGGTATYWAITGTIDGNNKTFSIATVAGSDFIVSLARQQQIQDIGASQWDYSYTTGGGTTTISYHTAPDASLSGQPHVAFIIS